MRSPPLYPVMMPSRPWDKLAMDIKGPLKKLDNAHLLVVITYYIKWPEAHLIRETNGEAIIRVLRMIFC